MASNEVRPALLMVSSLILPVTVMVCAFTSPSASITDDHEFLGLYSACPPSPQSTVTGSVLLTHTASILIFSPMALLVLSVNVATSASSANAPTACASITTNISRYFFIL